MLQSVRFSVTQCSHISTVTVIGGGMMGSGIAQVVAQKGQKVSMVEVNEEALTKSRNSILANLQKAAKKSKNENADKEIVEPVMGRISFTTNLEEAASKSDLVIEAVAENLKLKQKIFSTIDKVAPEKTIFGTNTSSLSVRDIASATNRLDRFAGIHFFNPVPILKLVELVRTNEVSETTYDTLKEWIKSIGKIPIACKDTPGFIVNRLLFPMINEAIKMYERGDAEIKDIDMAMKLGANHPMGPIELSDWIGHDTIVSSSRGWREIYPDDPLYQPLKSQEKLVEEGKFGYKTGEGYYKYK